MQAVCATLQIRLCFEILLLGSKFWFNYNRLFLSVKRIYTIFFKNLKNNCKFVIIANYHLSLLWIMATFPVKRCYNPYNTFHCKRNQKKNPIQNSVNYTLPICHISFAYSAMVRSELNLPAEQIFSQHFFANASSLL